MKTVQVGASSKKAGKTALAEYLVRELKADWALKISSGGHHAGDSPVTTNPRIIARPGTDTGKLVVAGAKKVVWVSSSEPELEKYIKEAMEMFEDKGLLVVEGNSGSKYLEVDFTVFIMNVPVRLFKESAYNTISKAKIVLTNRSGTLSESEGHELHEEIPRLSPNAEIIELFDGDYNAAFSKVTDRIRKDLSL